MARVDKLLSRFAPEHAERLVEVAANALLDLYSLNQIIRHHLARQSFKIINKNP